MPPPASSPVTKPPAAPSVRRPFLVALTGNPNCGKTTLFNALTGLRAKVGNYAGVTVERKEGPLQGAPPDRPVTILDLPGTYSLSPQSLDEQIVRDVLLARLPEVRPPDLVVVVVDASNLERNLYYATQVLELGYPTLIALNMVDVARDNGLDVDAGKLAQSLGVPVFPLVASTRAGVPALRAEILRHAVRPPGPLAARPGLDSLPPAMEQELAALGDARLNAAPPARARAEALLLLTDEPNLPENARFHHPGMEAAVLAARQRLEAAGVDWRTRAIEARYERARALHDAAVTVRMAGVDSTSDRLDRVFTHKIWGSLIFFALMALMFQGIFTFARVPMDLLEGGFGWLGRQVGALLPPGDLRSLLVDGVIAGVGAVVVFLPQICLLFLFLGLLEDTGYMARAAFLMDRLMSKVGLHGKSFIPLLGSFACAIPGIMATRTIENPKDRLVTILVAPLMTCSARLPVYTLLIAACIPDRPVLGWFHLPGLTLMGLYLLGIVLALGMAWIFKKTLLRGHTPVLILELPPYKRPTAGVLLRHMWDRAKLFLQKAGTVILGINILLWFLATYPRHADLETPIRSAIQDVEARRADAAHDPARAEALHTELADLETRLASTRLRHSFAGGLGHVVEPLLRPLGFDWQIGIGIVSSFAAREVFVSTMSVVYSVSSGGDPDAEIRALATVLREQRRPDGALVFTPLTGLTLLVFYVAALQCASTVAVVRRETNSWKWPLFQWLYLGALAWGLAFLTRTVGRSLGLE